MMFNFKKFFGEKDESPLANVEEVTRILDYLPVTDPVQSLQELTHWLNQLATKENFKLKKRIQLAERFDQSAQQHVRKLLVEYIKTPRMNKARDETIWNTCKQFESAVNLADFRCLADYQKDAEGVSAEEIALLAVRAMRALTMQVHWLHLRYQSLPEDFWDKIYAIFNVSEQYGFSRLAVSLNAYAKVETSVLVEMLKILMMEVSSPDQLTKSQIEIARLLIEDYATSFVWEDLPAGGTVFHMDFASRNPPLRLSQMTQSHFMTRCFGPGKIVSSMVIALKQLESGAIPKGFDIQRFRDFEREDLLEVLLHLSQAWGKAKSKSQEELALDNKRDSQRKKAFSYLDVIHGLGNIHKKLHSLSDVFNNAHAENDINQLMQKNIDASIQVESWVVENVSKRGYGLTIPSLKQDWVQGSVVLAVKLSESPWAIGVIRRIEVDKKADTRVGISVLSLQPVAVRLRPVITDSTVWESKEHTSSAQNIDALLLKAEPPTESVDTLLVEMNSYHLHRIYELITSEGTRLIRLDFCEENFKRLDRVAFSEVKKEDLKKSASLYR
ncbi:hypothetical protein EDC63_10320 [Sulfurirhabdus autotrophica]|uniref:PilZ domain-containing protein n=2 Tax=Sulfurirhabdus autotrophica TaxID=1706046 RepID=A0A4V2W2Q6_9PROT|nr:hypothetical protein EDC63_10320 [Sulfurirhabdus autotrophica]